MSRIAILDRHGVLWARADGPFGGPACLELEVAVLEAANVGRFSVTVLDLSQTPSVDSCGVGALVRLQTALATKGRRLILANPTTAVADELRLRDLYAFFQISYELHPDMDQEELLLASDL